MLERSTRFQRIGVITIVAVILGTANLAQATVYLKHRHGWNGGNVNIPGNTKSMPTDRGNMNKAITRGSS
jgi:hypothetical protein